jgi:hypothetical protein
MERLIGIEELKERADLLAYIEKLEGDAEWTDIDEATRARKPAGRYPASRR